MDEADENTLVDGIASTFNDDETEDVISNEPTINRPGAIESNVEDNKRLSEIEMTRYDRWFLAYFMVIFLCITLHVYAKPSSECKLTVDTNTVTKSFDINQDGWVYQSKSNDMNLRVIHNEYRNLVENYRRYRWMSTGLNLLIGCWAIKCLPTICRWEGLFETGEDMLNIYILV